jgi:hypothetical protein
MFGPEETAAPQGADGQIGLIGSATDADVALREGAE